jgi:hypothetical protein
MSPLILTKLQDSEDGVSFSDGLPHLSRTNRSCQVVEQLPLTWNVSHPGAEAPACIRTTDSPAQQNALAPSPPWISSSQPSHRRLQKAVHSLIRSATESTSQTQSGPFIMLPNGYDTPRDAELQLTYNAVVYKGRRLPMQRIHLRYLFK